MEKPAKARLTTVDDYIASQPEWAQATLQEIRQVIKQAAPEVEEMISYQMPGYTVHGKLIWFAAAKTHYGIYVVPAILQVFKDKLAAYELTKSAIRISVGEPIPAQLLTEIVQYGAQKNLEQKVAKKQTTKKK